MSSLIQGTDTVRRIVEEEKATLVSFQRQDGYFRLPDYEGAAALQRRLADALESGEEIIFLYDKDLTIHEIL